MNDGDSDGPPMDHDDHDDHDVADGRGDATAVFERHRRRLYAIAYRMTGSVADAEDICQDAWLRWAAVDPSAVVNAEALLVRVTSRLALDKLTSAARRRETYPGPYLPEPVVTAVGQPPDPESAAELADSLTYSFLVLLDQLSPAARVTLLLHDVFGYSFEDCATATDSTVTAVRQQASRARRQLQAARGTEPSRPVPPERFVAFAEAITNGDVDGVLAALAPGVVLLSDGGPNRRAARQPVVGAERVAPFLLNLARRTAGATAQVVDVNGRLGVVWELPDQPPVVVALDADGDGAIVAIYLQLNPDKLAPQLGSRARPPQ